MSRLTNVLVVHTRRVAVGVSVRRCPARGRDVVQAGAGWGPEWAVPAVL
jgi:hypothetical protein